MYLTAETVTVDEDEGRFTLEIVDDEGDRHSFIIHHIDLDAFYDQVKGRIGPYLREMHEERARFLPGRDRGGVFLVAPADVDESGGYASLGYLPEDPKHSDWHSVHADIYDQRAGK